MVENDYGRKVLQVAIATLVVTALGVTISALEYREQVPTPRYQRSSEGLDTEPASTESTEKPTPRRDEKAVPQPPVAPGIETNDSEESGAPEEPHAPKRYSESPEVEALVGPPSSVPSGLEPPEPEATPGTAVPSLAERAPGRASSELRIASPGRVQMRFDDLAAPRRAVVTDSTSSPWVPPRSEARIRSLEQLKVDVPATATTAIEPPSVGRTPVHLPVEELKPPVQHGEAITVYDQCTREARDAEPVSPVAPLELPPGMEAVVPGKRLVVTVLIDETGGLEVLDVGGDAHSLFLEQRALEALHRVRWRPAVDECSDPRPEVLSVEFVY